MIRILVLTPFRHQFRHKDIWLMSHESYYLDSTLDKDEIKYILSDSFPYREFIYLNTDQLDKELIDEVASDRGFTPVNSSVPEPSTPQDSPITPNSFDRVQEPDVNIFEQRILEQQGIVPQHESSSSLPQVPLAPVSLPEPEINNSTSDISDALVERKERLNVLTQLHWRKVKDIAEQYDILYTDKDEVIQKIISLEFD